MDNQDEIILYQNVDGSIRLDVTFSNESVWLTQEQMATLFGKSKSTISEHIKNTFSEGELIEGVVVRKFRITTQHGAIAGKGFALNDERFKSGSSMNYFRELLDRIRDIRLSERVFYQQIKDIYRTNPQSRHFSR